ncbi:MAG: glycosyltransferase family 4 protein [Meiothermus sp.]|nr:glycosyltransferase family 4 protein [Meiothermus sp.]
MRILFCTPRLPFPPVKGDQSVALQRLKHLSRKHEIVLLSFFSADEELSYLTHLKPYCTEIHVVRLEASRSILNMIIGAVNPGMPFQVSYYQSTSFTNKLHTILNEQSFDLVHSVLVRLAPYMQTVKQPQVVDLIDSMTLNMRRRVARETGLKRLIFSEELRRVRQYERSIIGRYRNTAAIVVSRIDQQELCSPKVRVIPLGIDLDTFYPPPEPQSQEKIKTQRIIFSGNMGYEPNISAVEWFVGNCLETIRRTIPEVELHIVGTNPSNRILKLAQRQGIVVTGWVESIADYLRNSSVAIAPMQSGSGMQYKILEAMACGLPVVTTPIGLGDIRAQPNQAILVAESRDDFAREVIQILSNPEQREKIGQNAHDFVNRKHSWSAVNQELDMLYAELAGLPS